MILLYLNTIVLRIFESYPQTIQISRKTDVFETISDSKTTQIIQKQGSIVSDEYSYVASKRGQYFYPKTCSKAKALSIQNMLYFKDILSATQAGYSAAKGC